MSERKRVKSEESSISRDSSYSSCSSNSRVSSPARTTRIASNGPGAWKRVKLGEICQSIADGDHLAPPKCDSGIPFATISDIRNNKFDLSHITRYVPKVYFDSIDEKRRIRKGDVLYSVVGSYGIPVYADADLDVAFQRHIAILKPRGKVDSRFLYYSLLNPAFYHAADNVAIGAAQKTITLSALRNLEIRIPPLPTQRRIADILSAYDDKIANNRRRMELLEETARLLYRKMTNGKQSNGTIADICREERNGVRPSDVDPKMPYIGLEHMPRRSISLCDWEDAQKVTSAKLAFKAGDILFGKIRPYFHKVGMTFVDGVVSSDAVVIKPLHEELRPFVLLTVSSDAFVAAASQGMKEGSKMPRADWKQLLKYAIWVPDDNLLDGFNVKIKPILNELKTLCLQNHQLADARDLLLPRLMKGEFRI